jgi:predicted acyltransferase
MGLTSAPPVELKPDDSTRSVEIAPLLPATPAAPGRLVSLDAYRGFVMFLMVAEVLRLSAVRNALPQSAFWGFLAHHQTHASWLGCSLHDLIQPSFSFVVGVALPFSIANRLAKGQSQRRLSLHAFWRAFVLVWLGVFLRSLGRPYLNFTFEDTLSQIGLGYGVLFLLGFRPMRDQWIALGAILVGYWAAFALFPLPDPKSATWFTSHAEDKSLILSGFAAHWNKNTNPAWAFDTGFLNLFYRETPFTFNGGGYATLSFIPTLGTMILGLLAGGVLRNRRSPWWRVAWFTAAGLIGIGAGWALGHLGLCPVVKRIWTPSWVLFSGGWCFLLLAVFYGLIEIARLRKWAFFFIVFGMNSIGAYVIAHLWEGFFANSLRQHLGFFARIWHGVAETTPLPPPDRNFFDLFGAPYEPLILGAATLLMMWLVLFWMYRRKLFLKI